MRAKAAVLFTALMAVGLGAVAQTVTGGGTSGMVPVFTGSSTVGNSPISVSGDDVGIGTTAPTASLSVIGTSDPTIVDITDTSSGGHRWGFGSFGTLSGYSTGGFGIADWTAGNWRVYLDGAGNVGIGTTNPTAPLHIAKADAAYTNVPMQTWDPVVTGYGLILSNYNSAAGVDYRFTQLNGGTSSPVLTFTAGNVGIGTTAPGATLEVNGNVRLTTNSGASITFADGTTQSTAYTGVSCGGDFAESVDASGKRNRYEPGDVLVVASDEKADVTESSEPYSTLVAGIYSTKPGYVGRRLTGPRTSAELPLAMVGIVPTKVSAENGPIRKGDLLVTASLKGYAMKGTDRNRMLGAVLGKAMGSLGSGRGVIEVLVTLQ